MGELKVLLLRCMCTTGQGQPALNQGSSDLMNWSCRIYVLCSIFRIDLVKALGSVRFQ